MSYDESTLFDDALKKINHFSLHPQLLPFIGKNYNKMRILLIGESHYLSKETSLSDKDFENWYTEQTTHTRKFDKINNEQGWSDTRSIVNDFLDGNRRGDYGGRAMFYNPENAFKDYMRNQNVIFDYFAFFNYYQRPCLSATKSIALMAQDEEYSYKIACDIINILKPKCIIFLSKKAYKSFIKLESSKEHSRNVFYTVHPTSAWWNRVEGKYGKHKFKEILKSVYGQQESK